MAPTCHDDILKCPLKPHSEFSVLLTIVIIIGAFAVGKETFIWFMIYFIIKKLILSNKLIFKLSIH